MYMYGHRSLLSNLDRQELQTMWQVHYHSSHQHNINYFHKCVMAVYSTVICTTVCAMMDGSFQHLGVAQFDQMPRLLTNT